jgi:hypothetical protein
VIRVVTNWTARRSGAAMVIEGINPETGVPVRVTGVHEIKGASPNPNAEGNIRGQGRSIVTLRGN